MSLVSGVLRRVKESWRTVSWSWQKNATHRCAVAGTQLELNAPTRRQLDAMLSEVLTDKNIAATRKYFQILNLGNSGTILDVGANIGYTALAYSLAVPGMRIMAFEPSQLNQSYFLKNTASRSNVFLEKVGLHHTAVKMSLRLPSEEQNKHMKSQSYRNTGLYSLHGKGELASASIDVVRLDDWMTAHRRYEPVKFMKIDVEGNELAVLRGATSFLKRSAPVIELEMNPSALAMAGESFETVSQFLRDYGYRAYHFYGQKLLPVTQAPTANENLIFKKEG